MRGTVLREAGHCTEFVRNDQEIPAPVAHLVARGAQNAGTVFKLTPEGVEAVLYSFSGLSDGGTPTAALIQGRDGNLYGTTLFGGTNSVGALPGGTLFQRTLAGVITELFYFGHSDTPKVKLVQGSDGNLYGATYGGGAHDSGYFFE